MNEFKVNEYITLKLEGNVTNIFVNGKKFMQCKRLVLNVPIIDIRLYDNIDSIDEASEYYDHYLLENQIQKEINGKLNDVNLTNQDYEISYEAEFWGHCSNLQAWYDHDYDTRLLHSNLAFPLLKELAEIGDPVAKKMFKEEIAKRFESGYPTVVAYILQEHLLDYLNREERSILIEQCFPLILAAIEKLSGYAQFDVYYNLLEESNETELLEENFSSILELIKNISYEHQYDAFSKLLGIANATRLIKVHFSAILGVINKLSYEDPYDAFSDLLGVEGVVRLLKEHFPEILETINKLPNEYKYEAFSDLLEKTKETGWLEEHFSAILESVDGLRESDKYDVLSMLLEVAKRSKWIGENFNAILDVIDKLPKEVKYDAFSDLINLAKGVGIIKEPFLAFYENVDDRSAFSDLLEVEKETGWLEENFLTFLNATLELPGKYKYSAFYDLIDSVKSIEILNKYHSQIETQFQTLMKNIGNLGYLEKGNPYKMLIRVAKEIGVMKEYLTVFLNIISKLAFQTTPYTELIKLTKEKGWTEEFFTTFLEIFNKLPYEEKYFPISELCDSIKSTGLLNKYYSQFQTQFLTIIKGLDNLTPGVGSFSQLVRRANEFGLMKTNFPIFLKTIERMHYKAKYNAFYRLIESIKNTELLNEKFLTLVNFIDKLPNYGSHRPFNELIKSIKGNELLNEGNFKIETLFLILEERIEKFHDKNIYSSFYYLINTIENMDLLDQYYSKIENQFLVLEENIENLPDKNRYRAFYCLINAVKSTDLLNKYYSKIEIQFLTLVASIEKLPFKVISANRGLKLFVFSSLVEVGKITGLIQKHNTVLLAVFPELPNLSTLEGPINNGIIYFRMIDAIKGTKLESTSDFMKWKKNNWNLNYCKIRISNSILKFCHLSHLCKKDLTLSSMR